jgi:pilus assembly protein CpaE
MRTPKLLVLDDNEELSLQVQQVCASLRPSPGVVWCDTFDAVADMAAEAGPFDVLIAGPLASRDDGFHRLRALRANAPGTQLILALDRWKGTSLRDTVRTGALDILRLPVTDDDLRDALEQAIAVDHPIVRRRGDDRRVGEDRGKESPEGTVIAVVSATGGCGKTFFATNLAYHLQSHGDRRTCLIDLDLQFGELATALRLRPRHTIHDLLSSEVEGDDLGLRLEEDLERHESGIRLLAAPDEPAQADAIDPTDVARVIEAARSRFDYVIVDTPAALSESVLVAVEQADQIFALATLDLPSVRNLGVMLSTLKKLNVPVERISLLLNKVEPDVGIDVDRVEQYFPQGFSMVVPYGREVNRSLNMGQPVLAYAPRGEVSRSLLAGLDRALMMGNDDGDGSAAPERRRRFSWPHRKSA